MAAAGKSARRRIGRWMGERIAESTHCHECGAKISPLDDYCPNCGQNSPAKLNVSPVCYVAGAAALAVSACWLL